MDDSQARGLSPALRQIRMRRIDSIGGNCSGLSGAAGNMVQAPRDGGIGSVCNRCCEGNRSAKEHCSALGRHDYGDYRRWWLHRACAPTATAQNPCTRGEEHTSQQKATKRQRSYWQGFFFVT